MIKEFETMFPRCLWVAKDTNYKEINDRFKLYSTSTETEIDYNEKTFKKDSSDCDAYVYLAQDKTSNKFGYLVFLIENIDVGVCAHEATHICKRMEDHFELERDANEYRAYMAEWYTKKIYEFWNEKVNYPQAKDLLALGTSILKQNDYEGK